MQGHKAHSEDERCDPEYLPYLHVMRTIGSARIILGWLHYDLRAAILPVTGIESC